MADALELKRRRAARRPERRPASQHGPPAQTAVAAPQAPQPVFRLDGQATPASVAALQAAAGNQAVQRHVAAQRRNAARPGAARHVQRLWGRKKKPTDAELKELKPGANKPGFDRTTNAGDVAETPEGHKAENLQEGLGYGADLTGVPGDAMSSFGGNDERLDGEELSYTGSTEQGVLSSAGAAFGTAGSVLTAGGGVIGVLLAVKQLRELAQSTDPGKRWDQASTLAVLLGSGSSALLGGGQAVAGLVNTGGNIAAAAGKDAGEAVATGASGVMDGLGALGGIVEVGVSTFQGALGIMKMVKDKEFDADLAGNVGMDFLKALKGLAVVAKSTVGAANSWLQIAGAASAVLPVVGAAINIVAQMVDILIQAVDVVLRVYKIVKARIISNKLKLLQAGQNVAADMQNFAAGMAVNARKRWRRQIAPLIGNAVNVVADFISIGASVLNIVGTATSAAYGAGVALMATGYAASAGAGAMKVGAALIKPAQAIIRKGKQRIRDKGQTSARYKKVGNKLGIDMTRTTDKKNEEVAGQISFLMKHLHGLPDLPNQTAPNYTDVKAEYERAHLLVKSTGVKVKDLTGATEAAQVVKILAKAIRNRE